MHFDTHIFWTVPFSSEFLHGALISLALAACAQVLATIGGFALALCRVSKFPGLRGFGATYVWLFRAIPTLLVLLILWNAFPTVVPALRETWYSPFIAALIGFAIVESAYMAEVLRSALISIDDGQKQAGRALGMTSQQVMRKVLIPQMIRVALPPTGNEFIGMVKYTALASVISLRELLSIAQAGVSVTFSYLEYYSAALVYYLVIVSALMLGQGWLERRYRWISRHVAVVPAADAPVVPVGGLA